MHTRHGIGMAFTGRPVSRPSPHPVHAATGGGTPTANRQKQRQGCGTTPWRVGRGDGWRSNSLTGIPRCACANKSREHARSTWRADPPSWSLLSASLVCYLSPSQQAGKRGRRGAKAGQVRAREGKGGTRQGKYRTGERQGKGREARAGKRRGSTGQGKPAQKEGQTGKRQQGKGRAGFLVSGQVLRGRYPKQTGRRRGGRRGDR